MTEPQHPEAPPAGSRSAMARIVESAARSGGAASPGELIPAATVVPLRDGAAGLETLMLRRSGRGVFGGVWVFPGGQVDPGDVPEGAGGSSLVDPDDAVATEAARRAAVREAREEAALALGHETLVEWSFWVPPLGAPRRFATWFFLVDATTAAEVVVDRTEIKEHRWMTPEAALVARDAGEIELVPPTVVTLWWLARQPSVAGALAAAASAPPQRFSTHLVTGEGGKLLACVWEGDAAYEDGVLDRPGPRRRLLTADEGWRVEMGS